MARNEKIEMMDGDTWHREVMIKDPVTGQYRGLQNFKIWFTMKVVKSDPAEDAVIRKRWLAGVSHGLQPVDFTDPQTGQLISYGKCPVEITSADQANLEFGTTYFWALQVVSPEGRVMTQHDGTFTFNEEDMETDIT